MKAWQLHRVLDLSVEKNSLVLTDLPAPRPDAHELLIRISCCGVCHTELDEIEGRTPPPKYPIVPGHQVIGRVEALGERVSNFSVGDRVGVAWLFSSCGVCEYCLSGRENLCPQFRATGRDADGGYAEYMVAPAASVCLIPGEFEDVEAAPLLCAGAIGYRSLKLANLQDGQTLGLTGFGASAHLVLKMSKSLYPNSEIIVFARSAEEQQFARSLGAAWAGDTQSLPPYPAHAIIDTTPAWRPVVEALAHLRPGGRLVINAIRKEPNDREILITLDYPSHLWMEKEIKSVANITAADVREFLDLAARASIRPKTEVYSFEEANQALWDLKNKHILGAKVLRITT